ncbi:hypothetical protein EWM64_g10820, partial [Hericium alpestre]
SDETYPALADGRGKLHKGREREKGKGREKGQEEEEDVSPGGKLWKLVKRISTGGLRDRYQSGGSIPPPVPAIPKGLLSVPSSRATFEDVLVRCPTVECTWAREAREAGIKTAVYRSSEGPQTEHCYTLVVAAFVH